MKILLKWTGPLLLVPAAALALLGAEKRGTWDDLCLDCDLGEIEAPLEDVSATERSIEPSCPSDGRGKGVRMNTPWNPARGKAPECSLPPPEQNRRLEAIRRQILSRSISRERTEEAWILRFHGESALLDKLMEFIRLERECCRFLRFSLHINPYGRDVILELGGNADVLNFLGKFLTPSAEGESAD